MGTAKIFFSPTIFVTIIHWHRNFRFYCQQTVVCFDYFWRAYLLSRVTRHQLNWLWKMSDISKEEMVFLLKDVIKLQLANESVIDIHSSKSARTSSSLFNNRFWRFGEFFYFCQIRNNVKKAGKFQSTFSYYFLGKVQTVQKIF